MACDILGSYGYERYEISNFAKPGYQSRHNMKYWSRAEYIGLGLGAHSFSDEIRWHNTESIDEYVASGGLPEKIRRGITPITKTDAMAEFMFLSLRLSRGVSGSEFHETFGIKLHEVYGSQIKKHLQAKTLVAEKGRLFLTERGISVSNVVMSEFI
jgi:oxygen-independent coproporphyrinogen-3 oxidase